MPENNYTDRDLLVMLIERVNNLITSRAEEKVEIVAITTRIGLLEKKESEREGKAKFTRILISGIGLLLTMGEIIILLK